MDTVKLLNVVLSSVEEGDLVMASDLLSIILAKEEDSKTLDDYIKEGWVVQRLNDDTGKKEWCLVDHAGKKTKEGEKKNLKWFGTSKPNVKEVKERIAEVKYFKTQK